MFECSKLLLAVFLLCLWSFLSLFQINKQTKNLSGCCVWRQNRRQDKINFKLSVDKGNINLNEIILTDSRRQTICFDLLSRVCYDFRYRNVNIKVNFSSCYMTQPFFFHLLLLVPYLRKSVFWLRKQGGRMCIIIHRNCECNLKWFHLTKLL